MHSYGGTPNMDEHVLRLPRPLLWVNHRRRINMDAGEDSQTHNSGGFEHLTDRFVVPAHISRSTPPPHCSSPTPIRLTSANLAVFDDKHSDHHHQLRRSSARLSASHSDMRPPQTAFDYNAISSANTDATDDYRLTMESITQLSCSAISMPDDVQHQHQPPCAAHHRSDDTGAFDTNSTVSSTNFTLVNGFGAMRYNKKPAPGRRYCCCSPITAVIITMTVLLAVIVFLMIFFIEYPHMTSIVE